MCCTRSVAVVMYCTLGEACSKVWSALTGECTHLLQQVLSQTTGDTYYKNLATGEAVWDFPSYGTNNHIWRVAKNSCAWFSPHIDLPQWLSYSIVESMVRGATANHAISSFFLVG